MRFTILYSSLLLSIVIVLSGNNFAFCASKSPNHAVELESVKEVQNAQNPSVAEEATPPPPNNQDDKNTVAEQTKFDRIAKYLAGYDEAPADHKLAMDALWQHYEIRNLKAFQDWQKQEMTNITDTCSVFYPFSGPDVLHMLTLFPTCKKYIMIGLEAPGKLENLTKEKIHLTRLRQGISSLLSRSFFVTREMWEDFAIERNGIITPILTLLKRMNYDIVNVERIYLSNTGVISDQAKVGNGLKIIFKAAGKEDTQELYYFKKILTGNAHGVNELLKSSDFLITYLKAAQYALFDPRFALIRSAIIEKSSIVLQDDSGLPFRYLNNKQWQLTFYGNYEAPYGREFAGYIQKDLKKTYQSIAAKPLPFSLGYGYKKINSMMLKAIKVKSTVATPAVDSIDHTKDLEQKPLAAPTQQPPLADEVDATIITTPTTTSSSKLPGMAIKH